MKIRAAFFVDDFYAFVDKSMMFVDERLRGCIYVLSLYY